MAHKRSSEEAFIRGTIQRVAEIGIENTRTKDVADYAGYSETTMYRKFPTKEILLREAFLYVDRRIAGILMKSDFVRNPEDTPFDLGVCMTWHEVFRFLVDHKDETMFLIRYKYSSYYTEEVRNMRPAYNGSLDKAYEVFETHFKDLDPSYRGFLLKFIFETTICFAEKIITGKMEDSMEAERSIWLAVNGAMQAWLKPREGEETDEQ